VDDMLKSTKENVLIFGVGQYLYEIIDYIVRDYNILAVVDNDSCKVGNFVICSDKKIPIISPSSIGKYEFDKIIVTLYFCSYQYAVYQQLLSLNIPSKKIYGWGNGKPFEYPLVNGIMKNNTWGKFFFDVNLVSVRDVGTGVQRVTNNLYRNLFTLLNDSLVPIRWFGELITAEAYRRNVIGTSFNGTERRVELTAHDKLILADLSLMEIDYFLQEAILNGTETYTIVYDLLPLSISTTFSDGYSKNFLSWLECALSKSDHVLCISRTVADDVIAFYRKHEIKRTKQLNVHYFHLGFNIPAPRGKVRPEIKDFVQRKNVFLMVGTIEPRKNHVLAIQALRRIWQNGEPEVHLLIIGRDGWKNEAFKSIIEEHDVSEHVLWISNASDAELSWAYQNTMALLYPSKNEGYGLPIVEAAYYQLPIICSGIPILHELSGDNVTYFKVDSIDSLTQTIETWLKEKNHPDVGKIKLYSWQDSAREVFNIVRGQANPYMVLSP